MEYFSAAIGSQTATYLGGSAAATSLGMAITSTVGPIMKWCFNRKNPFKITEIVISEMIKQNTLEVNNPIFYPLALYYTSNMVSSDIKRYEATAEHGRIKVIPNDNAWSTIKYNNIKIWFKLEGDKKVITLQTRDGNYKLLKEFIVNCVKKYSVYSKDMVLYSATFSKDEKNKVILSKWDEFNIKNTKTPDNIILSDINTKLIIDEADEFITNEELYHMRGLTWNRGWLLQGPPGTGKTSVIRALASKYKCPVFNVNLSVFNESTDLTELENILLQISNICRSKVHILVFDEMDKCNWINRVYGGSRYSLTTSLLTILDGVASAHGRMLFITANNSNNIENIPALIRPGRVDTIVRFKACDRDQLLRMGNLYYDGLISDEDIPMEVRESIYPMTVINFIQEKGNDVYKYLKWISNQDKEITQNITFNEASTMAVAETPKEKELQAKINKYNNIYNRMLRTRKTQSDSIKSRKRYIKQIKNNINRLNTLEDELKKFEDTFKQKKAAVLSKKRILTNLNTELKELISKRLNISPSVLPKNFY